MPNMPYVGDDFWKTKGVHWEGTNCIIDDPIKAFHSITNPADDSMRSLDLEQHVFSIMCGMIRSRAFQLNNQTYPEYRIFFKSYSIHLGSGSGWNAQTAEDIRHIIERLRFQCGQGPPPDPRRPDVEWQGHVCYIHHLPNNIKHRDILQLNGGDPRAQVDGRHQDRSIVDFMGDIYKFEFFQFLKQSAQDATLDLNGVKFICDCPPNTGHHLEILQEKWNAMWEATRIRTDGAPIRRGHGAVRQSSHLPPGGALVPRHRHGPINIGYNGMRGEPLEFENGPLGRSVERQTTVLALPGADRHNAPV